MISNNYQKVVIKRPQHWKSPYSNDTYEGRISFYSFGKLKKILGLSKAHFGGACVDIGCGQGYFLLTLTSYFSKVFGIDKNIKISPDVSTGVFSGHQRWDERYQNKTLLDSTREMLRGENALHHNLEILEGDAKSMPVGNKTIDVVFAIDILEHCREKDAIYQEFCRILKNGGSLIYSVPNSVGIAQRLRNILAFFAGVQEDPASEDHKNYHWKKELSLLAQYFTVKKVIGFPFFVKAISPSILVQCCADKTTSSKEKP
ncbi:MAG: hypothetical protein A2X86_12150 [Bdellovibrionales bacterium GWA2_49_15]|nr:MAG: hypothetical protein A2X86_12150 [Bdellovibrionales bacterium GWA2_49_15]